MTNIEILRTGRVHRTVRWGFVCLVLAATALGGTGCMKQGIETMMTGSITPLGKTLSADVAPSYAIAYLPRLAGKVEAVHQSSKPNYISQTVLYHTLGYENGENRLSVVVAPASSDLSLTRAPTQRELVREMRAAFPEIKMHIANAMGNNIHGVFGYALGSSPKGETCIFAWQTAKNLSQSQEEGVASMFATPYAAKVRLRFCHPTMSERTLISLMSAMRIRDISSATIEMLRFAEGSAIAAQPSLNMPQEKMNEATAPAVTQRIQSHRSIKKHSAPVSIKTVVNTVPKPKEENNMVVRNAPRVLKPGELVSRSTALKSIETPASTTPKRKDVIVPDPQTTSSIPSPAIPLPEAIYR